MVRAWLGLFFSFVFSLFWIACGLFLLIYYYFHLFFSLIFVMQGKYVFASIPLIIGVGAMACFYVAKRVWEGPKKVEPEVVLKKERIQRRDVVQAVKRLKERGLLRQ